MGKEQELLDTARNCTLPVVKRLLSSNKIKKIGSISNKKNSDDGYKASKSGFSRSQESILDSFSTLPSTSHQNNHNSHRNYPPHCHKYHQQYHHASTSNIDIDPQPPLPPRDILNSTRAIKSVDSDNKNDGTSNSLAIYPQSSFNIDTYGYESIKRNHHYNTDDSKLDSNTSSSAWNYNSIKRMPGNKPPLPPKPPRDILNSTRASKSVDSDRYDGGAHSLTIYPQSSFNVDTYGYESIKRNHHHHQTADDSRLDAHSSSSAWSYNSIKRMPGNKPPVPPKPPRKSLANKENNQGQNISPKSAQSQNHDQQTTTTTTIPPKLQSQTKSHSQSKSHQKTKQTPGNHHDYSKRISSFDYVSDSGLGLNESCMRRSFTNDGGDCMKDKGLCNNKRLSTFLGPEKPSDQSSLPNFLENMSPMSVSSSLLCSNLPSNTSAPLNNDFTFENELAQLYDEIASEISGRETNSSLVSSISSVASLDHDVNKPVYAEPRRRQVKDPSVQQHVRSKSEHYQPRSNNNFIDETINIQEAQSSSSFIGACQQLQQQPSLPPEPIKSKRSTIQFPVNFKSLTRKSSKQIDPPSAEMALETIDAVIKPLYKMHDIHEEACFTLPLDLPDYQNCLLDLIISQKKVDLDSFELIRLEYHKPKISRYRDMETSTEDDSNERQIFVKLKNHSHNLLFENKNVTTENELTDFATDNDPFKDLPEDLLQFINSKKTPSVEFNC